MQPAIVNISTPPSTSLSFDTVVYFGQNQIRRNIGKSTSLYQGSSVVDRILSVKPNVPQVIDPEEGYKIVAIYIQSDQPLTATFTDITEDGTSVKVVEVNKLLVTDQPANLVSLLNSGSLPAKVKVAYVLEESAVIPTESVLLLEDGSGSILLEDGSGSILTEA